MKTIEEKARAYDIIIEKANKMHSENCEACQACIEELIPELKESEDKRISKRISQSLHGYLLNSDEIIQADAWLKKQAEHANFLSKIQVGDKVTRNENGVLVNLSQLNRVAKPEENKGNIGGVSANSAWSDEDEENFCSVYLDVKSARQNTVNSLSGDLKEQEQKRMDEVISWLESLKGRVQPKQEWNEEDEEILRTILSDGIRGAELDMLQVNWLKSLRPQNHWKPSDEQMSLLQAIINEPNNAASESCQIVLREVLEQLKKLKEGKV